MKQESRFDCLSFDPFLLFQNGLSTPEVNVSGRKVLKALMVAFVVVVLDNDIDLQLKIAWWIVVS